MWTQLGGALLTMRADMLDNFVREVLYRPMRAGGEERSVALQVSRIVREGCRKRVVAQRGERMLYGLDNQLFLPAPDDFIFSDTELVKHPSTPG